MCTSDQGRELAGLRRQVSGACLTCGGPRIGTIRRRYCSIACKLKAYRRRKWSVELIASRAVDGRAGELIVRKGLERLVREMAGLVDGKLEPSSYRGGSIVYQESIENPEDWEIVVVTRLAVSGENRFDISLRIGETLSQLISYGPYDPNWMHVTFSLELA